MIHPIISFYDDCGLVEVFPNFSLNYCGKYVYLSHHDYIFDSIDTSNVYDDNIAYKVYNNYLEKVNLKFKLESL